MKTPDAPFGLFDFLAYLFPGIATLHCFFLWANSEDGCGLPALATGSTAANAGVALVAAYALGFAWSVFSRQAIQRLTYRLWANPREDYLAEDGPSPTRRFREGVHAFVHRVRSGPPRGPDGDDSAAGEEPTTDRRSLGAGFRRALLTQIAELFYPNHSQQTCGRRLPPGHAAHRLCRVYVAQHCPAAWDKLLGTVARRSMCSNCAGPAFVYGAVLAFRGEWLLAAAALACGIALLAKTVTLDNREWKGVYAAFLAHRRVSATVSQTHHHGVSVDWG